jgi:hypothetical protein
VVQKSQNNDSHFLLLYRVKYWFQVVIEFESGSGGSAKKSGRLIEGNGW